MQQFIKAISILSKKSNYSLVGIILLIVLGLMTCKRVDPKPYIARLRLWSDFDTSAANFSLNVKLNGKDYGSIQQSSKSPCGVCGFEEINSQPFPNNDNCLIVDVPVGAYTITGAMGGYAFNSEVVSLQAGDCVPVKMEAVAKSGYPKVPVAFWRTNNPSYSVVTVSLGGLIDTIPVSDHTITSCADLACITIPAFVGNRKYTVYNNYRTFNGVYYSIKSDVILVDSLVVNAGSCSLVKIN